MKADAELLSTIADEGAVVHDLTNGRQMVVSRKSIAYWTGMSKQAISDYVCGKVNIPIGFWHDIFQHYFDPRIPELLFGQDGRFELIRVDFDPLAKDKDFFANAVKDQGAYHKTQVYIADILADGRIDELDGKTIRNYLREYSKHRASEATLHHQIINTYQASCDKKVAQL